MYGENIEILNKTMFSQDIDDIVEIERLPPVDIISITDYRPERYEIGGSKKRKTKKQKKVKRKRKNKTKRNKKY